MKRHGIALAMSLIFALGACVERETEKVDEAFVKANLLTSPPTPQHVINADLGGKIVYLGNDLDKETAALGDRVKITHYWKVVETPGADWRAFTHLNGPAGDWVNVDETKMRKQHGPDAWKMGDIVRDEQTFPVQKTWRSNEVDVYVGLYRKGGQHASDRMEVRSGPSDDKGRLLVAKIAVTGGAPAPPPSGYVVRRASGPITIDGKADEPDWAKAASTGPFRTAQGGDEPGGAASAKLLWDDKNLYVFVEVADKDVATQYSKHDDPLWKEDVVEVFIDADKNRHDYAEIQVNPRNATFDSWIVQRPNADPKWESGVTSAVVVDGTLDNRDDVDKGWKVEMAIPLTAARGKDEKSEVRVPPAVGDTWNLDIVRVEKPRDKGLAASAWAQIPISDFHAIDKLVTVTFGDEQGKAEAKAPPPAAKPSEDKKPEDKGTTDKKGTDSKAK